MVLVGSSLMEVTSTIKEPGFIKGATSRITSEVWWIGTEITKISLILAKPAFDSI